MLYCRSFFIYVIAAYGGYLRSYVLVWYYSILLFSHIGVRSLVSLRIDLLLLLYPRTSSRNYRTV